MNRMLVKTYKYKAGKNQYIVIQIFQKAVWSVGHGNALASNAVNVKIFKNVKGRKT